MPIFTAGSFNSCNNDANGHKNTHQRKNYNADDDRNGDNADDYPNNTRNFKIHNFFAVKIHSLAFVLANNPHYQRKNERRKKL